MEWDPSKQPADEVNYGNLPDTTEGISNIQNNIEDTEDSIYEFKNTHGIFNPNFSLGP